MDILATTELKLGFMEEQAGRADQRIAALAQEALMHRGGGQHLGALQALIEGHRDRLREGIGAAQKAQEEAKDAAQAQAAVDQAAQAPHQISGVHDALAYLRAQARAAEMSAQQAEAAMAEAQRTRQDFGQQAQRLVAEATRLRQQLAEGTPREELGRPLDAKGVREEVDRRRAAAQQAGPKRVPKERRGHA